MFGGSESGGGSGVPPLPSKNLWGTGIEVQDMFVTQLFKANLNINFRSVDQRTKRL